MLSIRFVASADCISFTEIIRIFRFREQYPEVQIELHNRPAAEKLEALRRTSVKPGVHAPLTLGNPDDFLSWDFPDIEGVNVVNYHVRNSGFKIPHSLAGLPGP
jgi:hypothetical protein